LPAIARTRRSPESPCWGVDDGANEFQICTSDCQAGSLGSGDGQFNAPFGVAADTAGNV
jgi:hypothetical protein